MASSVRQRCLAALLAGLLPGIGCLGMVCASAVTVQATVEAHCETSGTSDDGSDDENRQESDLGAPPVLLWDRAAKPVCKVENLYRTYPLADVFTASVRVNVVPFHVNLPIEPVPTLQPKQLMGSLHQPHGPPLAA